MFVFFLNYQYNVFFYNENIDIQCVHFLCNNDKKFQNEEFLFPS